MGVDVLECGDCADEPVPPSCWGRWWKQLLVIGVYIVLSAGALLLHEEVGATTELQLVVDENT